MCNWWNVTSTSTQKDVYGTYLLYCVGVTYLDNHLLFMLITQPVYIFNTQIVWQMTFNCNLEYSVSTVSSLPFCETFHFLFLPWTQVSIFNVRIMTISVLPLLQRLWYLCFSESFLIPLRWATFKPSVCEVQKTGNLTYCIASWTLTQGINKNSVIHQDYRLHNTQSSKRRTFRPRLLIHLILITTIQIWGTAGERNTLNKWLGGLTIDQAYSHENNTSLDLALHWTTSAYFGRALLMTISGALLGISGATSPEPPGIFFSWWQAPVNHITTVDNLIMASIPHCANYSCPCWS